MKNPDSIQHSARALAEMDLMNTFLSCFELRGDLALARHERRWGRDMEADERELWMRSYSDAMESFLEVAP